MALRQPILSRTVVLALAMVWLPSGVWATKRQAARPAIKRYFRPTGKPLSADPLVKTGAGSAHLDEGHYQSIRDGALAMLKKYPPANHYYVALGRSPVSMFTFLHALNPDMATTFPASDLRLQINPAHEPEYFKHFEKYIPAEVLRGERGDIVIFDRSHDKSGSSLAKLKPILERYLAQKGFKTKVVAVGFAAAGPLMAGVDFIDTHAFPKVFLYNNGADLDENVATYVGHHTIGTHDIDTLQANPEHSGFRKQMIRRMSRDKELDNALANEPHLTPSKP